MNKLKIKICGITSIEDALCAVNSGAHAIGFVFYKKSPRYITKQKARDIIRQLPPFVQTVGLFVDATVHEIDEICEFSKIDIAQIHFETTEHLYDNLNEKYIKVIRAKRKNDVTNFSSEYRIVDAFVEGFGGEGKQLDLSWFDGVDCSKIILAGGLNAENLKNIEGYGFYGVDVSSGVEKSKGVKDHDKIKNFIQKANELSS